MGNLDADRIREWQDFSKDRFERLFIEAQEIYSPTKIISLRHEVTELIDELARLLEANDAR